MNRTAVFLIVLLLTVSTFAIYAVDQQSPSTQVEVIHSGVHLGLELTATIESSTLFQGENLTVVAEVNNTLARSVEVNATSMTNPADGPCEQELATGVNVYSGNYSYSELFNNGSRPTPLLLYDPLLIYCPALPPLNFSYSFHPDSDIATIQAFNGGSPLFSETEAIKEPSVVTGYWAGSSESNISFYYFPAGKYTVVVFDAWGQEVMGYFVVS